MGVLGLLHRPMARPNSLCQANGVGQANGLGQAIGLLQAIGLVQQNEKCFASHCPVVHLVA